MPELGNPHDRFFKAVLARREVAADFLTHHLPPAVVGQLDLSTLERQEGTFVDDELREHLSDVLFRVQLRDGMPAQVYVLLEHKSVPDRLVALQLLRYCVRIWEAARRERAPLPPVIPLVFYHGRERWTAAPAFGALYEGPAELRAYWPDFDYVLADLSRHAETEIKGGVLLQVGLQVLRHIYSGDLGQRLPGVVALLRELADQETALGYLDVVLRYVVYTSEAVTGEDVERARAVLPATGDAEMPTLAEQWLEEGRQEGRQEGRREGRQEGRRQGTREGLLPGIELALELKFGAEGKRAFAEIRTIEDVETLRGVVENIRSASSADEVLRRVG